MPEIDLYLDVSSSDIWIWMSPTTKIPFLCRWQVVNILLRHLVVGTRKLKVNLDVWDKIISRSSQRYANDHIKHMSRSCHGHVKAKLR